MKGKTPTEENIMAAIDRAQAVTNRTQPTADVETLAPLQKQNSLLALLTMFQSQTNKYFRVGATAARNLAGRRGSKARNLRNLILVWSFLPMVFAWVSDAFQWNPKHQFRAGVLAPLNYALIAGQYFQSAYGWATGENWDFQTTPVQQMVDYGNWSINKLKKIIDAGLDPTEDIDNEDVIKLLEYMVKLAGMTTGTPGPYAVDVEQAIREESPERLLWSKYALGKNKPKSELDKKRDEYAETFGEESWDGLTKGQRDYFYRLHPDLK